MDSPRPGPSLARAQEGALSERARAAHVRVSASTSNLGSGFDCIGVAVNLWLEATASVRHQGGGDTIVRRGTLSSLDQSPARDLLARGFHAACDEAGKRHLPGIAFTVSSEIPIGYGLGSSAASVAAGALLANELLELALPLDTLMRECARLEGHPDNIGAALYGGAVVAVPHEDSYVVAPIELSPELSFVFALPDFTVSTRSARAALPSELPFPRAVEAAGRAAALIRGLALAHPALLAAGLADVLHTPYRRGLILGYDEVTAAAVHAGAFGATLSGAGSAIVAVARRSDAEGVGHAMRDAWQVRGVAATWFESGTPPTGPRVSHAPPPGDDAGTEHVPPKAH